MYSRGVLALFVSLVVFGLQVSSIPLQRASEDDLVARTSPSAIDEVLLARAILAELSLAARDIDDDLLALRSLSRFEHRSPAGDGEPSKISAFVKKIIKPKPKPSGESSLLIQKTKEEKAAAQEKKLKDNLISKGFGTTSGK